MTHFDLGPGAEFDKIRAIARKLGPRAHGLGDDCALVPTAEGFLVLSSDLSVEGVHFRRAWLTLEEIGWRATAASLSDLAAEGASPIGVLASLGVPREASNQELEALVSGIGEAVAFAGGEVLGGDLSTADQWVLDLTAVGRAELPVTRGGAKEGDGVWVTGTLGAARAALFSWRAGEQPAPGARRAFARPEPRIQAGRVLAALGARAMIDLSDGLGGDAGHLAAASARSLQLELDHLPIAPEVVPAAKRAGLPPAQFAAMGGEDYELLVTLPAEFDSEDAASFRAETGLRLTRIGWVGEGSGVTFKLGGQSLRLAGFDHFEAG